MQSSRLDELIRAERAVAPEAGADARVWAAIEHRLTSGPPPPEGIEAGAGAGAGAAGKATLLKVAAGVALIAAGVGAIASRGGAGPPVREDMPVVAAAEPARAPEIAPGVDAPRAEAPEVAPVPDVVSPSALVQPTDAPPVTAPAKSTRKAAKTKATTASEPEEEKPAEPVDFTAELALIEKIRRELKLGAWTGALALVDEHARKFGARGQLVQERMAYHVLALCALERVDDARRIGGELVKKWPDSTHLPRLQSSCAFK